MRMFVPQLWHPPLRITVQYCGERISLLPSLRHVFDPACSYNVKLTQYRPQEIVTFYTSPDWTWRGTLHQWISLIPSDRESEISSDSDSETDINYDMGMNNVKDCAMDSWYSGSSASSCSTDSGSLVSSSKLSGSSSSLEWSDKSEITPASQGSDAAYMATHWPVRRIVALDWDWVWHAVDAQASAHEWNVFSALSLFLYIGLVFPLLRLQKHGTYQCHWESMSTRPPQASVTQEEFRDSVTGWLPAHLRVLVLYRMAQGYVIHV